MMIRIILFLTAILSAGCSNHTIFPEYVHIIKESIELIDGFKSYKSIEEVRQYCNSLGYKEWVIFEDSKSPEGDRSPRFDIFVVEIDGYSNLENRGILSLRFYNDRLSDTWFYPKEYEAYLTVLLQEENIDLINNKEQIIDDLRIWKHKDYQGKFYVGWADIRLEEELFERID